MYHIILSQIRRGFEISTNLVDSAVKCKRLEGKVAVITGSTLGIGYGIAKRFTQEGAKVVICSRHQENVDRAVAKLSADGHEVTGIVCHVGNSGDRKKLLNEDLGPYAVSKTSLFGLCKYAAQELASEGIRVNCLAPGATSTRFTRPFYRTEETYQNTMKKIAIRCFASTEEVDAAAAFLASDFIT